MCWDSNIGPWCGRCRLPLLGIIETAGATEETGPSSPSHNVKRKKRSPLRTHWCHSQAHQGHLPLHLHPHHHHHHRIDDILCDAVADLCGYVSLVAALPCTAIVVSKEKGQPTSLPYIRHPPSRLPTLGEPLWQIPLRLPSPPFCSVAGVGQGERQERAGAN